MENQGAVPPSQIRFFLKFRIQEIMKHSRQNIHLTNPDIVEVPADVYNVYSPVKCHPSTSVEAALRLRILKSYT